MRRVDKIISTASNFILDESAQLELENRTARVPENEPRADILLYGKQIELLAKRPMVALLRLFETL